MPINFLRLRLLCPAIAACLAIAGCGSSASLNGGGGGNQTATTTTVAASSASVGSTGTVTLTAVVTNSAGAAFIAPTGAVTFYANGGTDLGNGTAAAGTYSTTYTLTEAGSALPSTTNVITASFAGDAYHTSSTSSAPVTVTVTGTGSGVATSTSTPTANPATLSLNQTTQLFATVTAITGSAPPTGNIAFVDTSNHNATVATAALTPGTGGGCTGACAGAAANVSGASIQVGMHKIEAVYQPSTTAFAASTSGTVTVTVNSSGGGTTASSTALTANPLTITAAQATTLTATVTGTGTQAPTGTINFYDQTNSTSLGSVTLAAGGTAGTATATAKPTGSDMADGTNTIIAEYSGDSTYQASTSASVSVSASGGSSGGSTASTTVVTISPTSIGPGGCINIQVAVSGASTSPSVAPTGDVTITVGGLNLISVGVSYSAEGLSYGYAGVCSNSGTVLGGSGTYAIVASYAGDSNYAASTNGSGVDVTVTGNEKANTTIEIGVPEGTSSTIALGSCGEVQATVIPTAEPNGMPPTGDVTFFDSYTTQLGIATPISSAGIASVSVCTGKGTPFTSDGSYTITGNYTGDDQYNAAASSQNAVIIVN